MQNKGSTANLAAVHASNDCSRRDLVLFCTTSATLPYGRNLGGCSPVLGKLMASLMQVALNERRTSNSPSRSTCKCRDLALIEQ